MINDEYVKFGTAKLLKEKGFDWECYGTYNVIEEVLMNEYSVTVISHTNKNSTLGDAWISAPTQQMACRWLREEHEIDIIPVIRHSLKYAQESPFRDYACRIYDCDGNIVLSATKWYSRYENAIESALEYVLTKLI